MRNLFFLVAAVALTTLFTGCEPKIDASDPRYFDEGVTINGVTWATRNVDESGKFTSTPESSGMFYQWNRKKGWPATGPVTGWTTTPATGSIWATANDPCPTGWHVPTKEDFEKLLAASVTKWWNTYDDKYGMYFGTTAQPYLLFLPAAGYRVDTDGSLSNYGIYGVYWANQQGSASSWAFCCIILETTFSFEGPEKTFGASVRCVKD